MSWRSFFRRLLRKRVADPSSCRRTDRNRGDPVRIPPGYGFSPLHGGFGEAGRTKGSLDRMRPPRVGGETSGGPPQFSLFLLPPLSYIVIEIELRVDLPRGTAHFITIFLWGPRSAVHEAMVHGDRSFDQEHSRPHAGSRRYAGGEHHTGGQGPVDSSDRNGAREIHPLGAGGRTGCASSPAIVGFPRDRWVRVLLDHRSCPPGDILQKHGEILRWDIPS